MLREYVIALAVVDEVQQVDVHPVAAVACNVERILCFYDEAQRIGQTLPESNRHMEAAGQRGQLSLEKDVFSWERCMGNDQKQTEYILDWVKKEKVGKLSVSWRCGTKMCKFLCQTSIAYSLEGKGIESAAEVYKASDGDENHPVSSRQCLGITTARYSGKFFLQTHLSKRASNTRLQRESKSAFECKRQERPDARWCIILCLSEHAGRRSDVY